jgi:hypothetical protein
VTDNYQGFDTRRFKTIDLDGFVLFAMIDAEHSISLESTPLGSPKKHQLRPGAQSLSSEWVENTNAIGRRATATSSGTVLGCWRPEGSYPSPRVPISAEVATNGNCLRLQPHLHQPLRIRLESVSRPLPMTPIPKVRGPFEPPTCRSNNSDR